MPVLVAKGRLLVCEIPEARYPFLTITEGWTTEQAKKHARYLGFKPLYIINVWSKS